MDGALKKSYLSQNLSLADRLQQDTFFDRGHTRGLFMQYHLATPSNTPERRPLLRM